MLGWLSLNMFVFYLHVQNLLSICDNAYRISYVGNSYIPHLNLKRSWQKRQENYSSIAPPVALFVCLTFLYAREIHKWGVLPYSHKGLAFNMHFCHRVAYKKILNAMLVARYCNVIQFYQSQSNIKVTTPKSKIHRDGTYNMFSDKHAILFVSFQIVLQTTSKVKNPYNLSQRTRLSTRLIVYKWSLET